MQATDTPTTDRPIYDTGTIRSQAIFEFKELLRYRSLVSNLVSRDLKIRYKRSVLGFVWVMLNPLLTMAVMVVVFTSLLRYSSLVIYDFPAYLLCGILIFTLFAQGTIAAMGNLLGNGNTLRRMYVPPSVFVVSAIGSALVNLIYSIIPFFILALLTGIKPNVSWLFLIVPCIECALFALGVGLIVAPVMVFFHDTFEIYSVFVTAYNYITPVFYPVIVFATKFPLLYKLEYYNPLFLYIDTARNAIMGAYPTYHPIFSDPKELIVAPLMAIGMFIIGWLFFTGVEGNFAYYF
ncbi:MAG: ABC transporter permease [Ktedonobacterales bacterium]